MPLFKKKEQRSVEDKRAIQRKLVLAQDDPEPTFDISSCGAKQIPERVYSMCKVLQKEVLLLHDNSIKDLKSGGDLKNLAQLRVLDLHGNLIQELPEEIKFLTSLQVLNVANNSLKFVPKEIDKLSSLQTLNVQGNKLKMLPDEIGNMKSLRTLNVSHNFVTRLPISLANVKTLENLIVDANSMVFPSQEIATAGTDEMMKSLCTAAGIEYVPPSKCLLPVLDGGLNIKLPENKAELEDQHIQKKIQELERERAEKLDKLMVEQQIRQAKEEEALLIAMNKKQREDMLKALSQDDSKAKEKLLIEQINKERKMNHALTSIAKEEQLANERVSAILQMNDRTKYSEQLLEQMEKDKIAMENLVKVTQEDAEKLRKKEVLAAMNALLENDKTQEKLLQDYLNMKNQANSEAMKSALDHSMKIDELLIAKDKDYSDMLKNIANEDFAQMEAFCVLQLQTDDKHLRITNQLELLERELQQLSFLEMERKKEKKEDNMAVLESNRQALAEMFVQLMEERRKREEELAKRLVELEERREGEFEDYWLIQFQRLMDQKPETLIIKENGCDENVAHVLADAHAQDYIANFARNKISWQILRDMKDDDLKQIGVHEFGLRWKILQAVRVLLDEEKKAAEKTKKLESESEHVKAKENALTPAFIVPASPSAPAEPSSIPVIDSIEYSEENSCVICWEAKRDVIFLPCGHVCCCSRCSSGLSECPICRQSITKVVKMFMV